MSCPEQLATVSIPKHVLHPAKWLNKARDDAGRSVEAARMVGTPGAFAASLIISLGQAILDAQTSTVSRRITERNEPMLRHAFLFLVVLFPIVAFAQAASLPVDLSTQDALSQLLSTLGGIKGATVLGITAVVLQAVLLFFRTSLASFAGKWRLLIVAGLSLVSGTIALVATGTPFLQALGDANTLAALQVLGHQTIKQFTEKA